MFSFDYGGENPLYIHLYIPCLTIFIFVIHVTRGVHRIQSWGGRTLIRAKREKNFQTRPPHNQLRPPHMGGARLAMGGAKLTKLPPRSLIIIGSLNDYKTSIYLFDNLPESLLKLFQTTKSTQNSFISRRKFHHNFFSVLQHGTRLHIVQS